MKFQKHSTIHVASPVLVWLFYLFCHLDSLGPRPRAQCGSFSVSHIRLEVVYTCTDEERDKAWEWDYGTRSIATKAGVKTLE